MLEMLLLGLIGGAVILANWDKITSWLDDLVQKLNAVWQQIRVNVPHAARVFGDLIMQGFQSVARIMHKLYFKKGDQWIEKTTTRMCDESEVPLAIRNKLSKNETDITEEIQKELQLEV